MAKIRIFVKGDLTPKNLVELDFQQIHYLRNVMRLNPGDTITVFNGRDGEYHATIQELTKNKGNVSISAQIRDQDKTPDVWLLFAPLKRDCIDLIAEKATELGVSSLQPINTRYTITTRVNVDRLTANAIEAAEQCGRLTVPDVKDARALESVIYNWSPARTLYYLDISETAEPIADAFAKADKNTPSAFVVGPEGGFSEDERIMLAKCPFAKPISLGKRILRAETACFAALACWQSICGDWK